uniref:Uncharacterized protein n=1 Tax=Picea sitchensis TaxID=3332 RepID=A9P107_PICSI|nr:unknown [Picea sitchensis]
MSGQQAMAKPIPRPHRLLSSNSNRYPLSKPWCLHACTPPHQCSRIIVLCVLNGGVDTSGRKEALRKLDLELERGNEREAFSIITSLQGKPGGLRGFGAARQVPQKIYSLEDLRLNKIDTTCLLSPVDTTLGGVRRNLQIAAVVGGVATWNTLGLNQSELLAILLAFLTLGTLDQVVNGGGVEALIVDTIGRFLSKKYRDRVAQVKSGKLSSGTLSNYSCIALAGVAAEYLLFGLAEGGLADIQQLDNLLKSLGFTQKKADSQIRWAVLNTITLLRRHEQARSKLAEAMDFSKSVGDCIDTIENELMNAMDI